MSASPARVLHSETRIGPSSIGVLCGVPIAISWALSLYQQLGSQTSHEAAGFGDNLFKETLVGGAWPGTWPLEAVAIIGTGNCSRSLRLGYTKRELVPARFV